MRSDEDHMDASRASDEDQNGRRFMAFLLHARHDEILEVHLRLNGCDFNVMIRIQAFHQSC